VAQLYACELRLPVAEAEEKDGRRRLRNTGRLFGPLLAGLVYALLPDTYAGSDGSPQDFTRFGAATAAIAVWMAVWWLSEAIPIYATALLPLALLPLVGAATMKHAAAPYAHPLIFLFMGGFLMALSMQRWGLHRRIGLVALRVVGERPARMVGGFMGATAMLSMWVSNTASAIMMLPVALSVIDLVDRQLESQRSGDAAAPDKRNFALALLLGIAYGASIGGIGTPIGTPPNLFLLSYLREHLGLEISFVRWLGVGLPLVAVFLPVAWLTLTRVLFPVRLERIEGGSDLVREEIAALGPMKRGERVTLVVFLLTATLWITRPLLADLALFGMKPLSGLTDAGVAMLGALSLFVVPVDDENFVLDWETATGLPWGILLLFGGGLSLAAAIEATGVGHFLAGQVTSLAGVPEFLVVVCIVTGIVFLTELTSNTATAATLIPIFAAVAPGLGIDPLRLAVPAALAASLAFMLPVATPPNAVVFGSGRIQIHEMSRAGLWLNFIGIALVPLLTYTVVVRVLSVG
jgi:sodium-dependent dicarboxylate transporter 2/3/5